LKSEKKRKDEWGLCCEINGWEKKEKKNVNEYQRAEKKNQQWTNLVGEGQKEKKRKDEKMARGWWLGFARRRKNRRG